ncbi:MAG: hypothetical protein NZ556_02920, partial [Fimbriimonadales bacterium]|nr:hypothetical protein [Fimbriimonadales bacterium]
FRWTLAEGRQMLNSPAGFSGSYATGVSPDGTLITGYLMDARGRTFGFRWTQIQGLQALPSLTGGLFTMGAAVAEGIIVGSSRNSMGRWQAVRWNGNTEPLNITGSQNSFATAVASDGNTIVGYSVDSTGRARAFRWHNGSAQPLGTLGGSESIAHGVSADGKVVVGISRNAQGRWQGFRWQEGRMQSLGAMTARAVSGDGTIVVGAGGGIALLWDTSGNLRPLQQEYAPLLSAGSTLIEAYAISSNRRYIVGVGYNAQTRRREAFVLDTDP